jgi:AcrR family transcriptional regulator
MSPAPARTSPAAIVAAARAILEEDGLDAVTMASVAARVGVRPPSLYKHVRDREDLVVAMVADAADELRAVVTAAATGSPGGLHARVSAVADAYRAFARRTPRAASLLYTDFGPDLALPQARLAEAARPVVELAGEIAGERDALPAARVLTAFVHGFTSMESAGAFRMGGDIDEAYRLGIAAIVRGLAAGQTSGAG